MFAPCKRDHYAMRPGLVINRSTIAVPSTEKRPQPNHSGRGRLVYSSIESTSATNLPASSPRYEATTLNTARVTRFATCCFRAFEYMMSWVVSFHREYSKSRI